MDYFKNRLQLCKIGKESSNSIHIEAGVPQGSVLGPLLFLIYIKDLAFSTGVDSCLFADDTTLSLPGAHFDSTLSLFNKKIETLLNWIKLNQLIINWSKTKLMCISSKICNIVTNSVIIDENQVEIVNSFKLIGVHIDRWLDFEFHKAEMVKSVNKKLFSLKIRSFYQLHFFKAFVLPHFDYCSSIFVFFNKRLT